MMTDEQKSKVAELKTAIAATVATTDGAPQGVRVAAVALKRELRRVGTTARELAGVLGIHESTLCRWERESGATRGSAARVPKRRKRAAGFRMVRVATPPVTRPKLAPVSSTAAPFRGLRVAHAPSGLVVDGLDVESLAALLRRMS